MALRRYLAPAGRNSRRCCEETQSCATRGAAENGRYVKQG